MAETGLAGMEANVWNLLPVPAGASQPMAGRLASGRWEEVIKAAGVSAD